MLWNSVLIFEVLNNALFELRPGDKIAVISSSDSLREASLTRLLAHDTVNKEFGLEVVYGKNSLDADKWNPLSISLRVDDFHQAFLDKSVNAIICSNGGCCSNDILPYIDWEIAKNNPKPFIGSSDITVLLNAIYAKTGMQTYFGPNFYKFGMKQGLEYTIEYFKKSLMNHDSYLVTPSDKWSYDKWSKNQDDRNFHDNDGYMLCNPGKAEGKILGGNLCSLNLLQGTEYMPSLKNSILFIEDDDLAGEGTYDEFNRNLQSLLQQPEADTIRGIVVGRFSESCFMTEEKIRHLFSTKTALKNIPIVANASFGHCEPNFTFPIGGNAILTADTDKISIEISCR